MPRQSQPFRVPIAYNVDPVGDGLTLPAARLPVATSSAAGAMPAADKVKLDALPTASALEASLAEIATATFVWDNGTAAYVPVDGDQPTIYGRAVFIDPAGTHDPASSTGGRDVAGDDWITGGPALYASLTDITTAIAALSTVYQPADADLADIAAIADAVGDIIIRGSSGWERLPKSATASHVLRAGTTKPEWVAPGGGVQPHLLRPSLTYGVPGVAFTINTTFTPNTSRRYYWPFVVQASITVTEITTLVNTLGAASHVRLGVYADNGAGYPAGALLISSGELTTSTTGEKTTVLGSPVVLGPGVYWACLAADGTAPVLSAATGYAPGTSGRVSGSVFISTAIYTATAYAALTDPLTAPAVGAVSAELDAWPMFFKWTVN